MADIIARCEARGLRMTDQRRVLTRVIGDAEGYPNVEELRARASAMDSRMSLATVCPTVKIIEEPGSLERHEFGDPIAARLGYRLIGHRMELRWPNER